MNNNWFLNVLFILITHEWIIFSKVAPSPQRIELNTSFKNQIENLKTN